MYNEEAYKKTRDAAISLKCPFERALLSRCVDCSGARRLLLAEREAITCTDPHVNAACRTFHAALHRNALFALRIDPGERWPFGKEIRAQCGGVLGLKEALGHEVSEKTDTAALVTEGLACYGDIEDFPYSEIMRGVVHYQPRKRRQ